jgi:hypothetical protein
MKEASEGKPEDWPPNSQSEIPVSLPPARRSSIARSIELEVYPVYRAVHLLRLKVRIDFSEAKRPSNR